MTIDYTKLNNQIVQQAYNATSAFLTEDQVWCKKLGVTSSAYL